MKSALCPGARNGAGSHMETVGHRLRNDLYCVGWGVKLYSNQNQTNLEYVTGSVTDLHDLKQRVGDDLQ